ncbi:MAG: hypothetical protein F2537_00945, partial [Actinobacteria bacterium]|nr:hypothetical protein [Actinomycetota bacterium]
INRGTESEQSTQARLDRAKEELLAAAEFDYVVINHQVEQSVAELVSLALRESTYFKGYFDDQPST